MSGDSYARNHNGYRCNKHTCKCNNRYVVRDITPCACDARRVFGQRSRDESGRAQAPQCAINNRRAMASRRHGTTHVARGACSASRPLPGSTHGQVAVWHSGCTQLRLPPNAIGAPALKPRPQDACDACDASAHAHERLRTVIAVSTEVIAGDAHFDRRFA